MFSCRGHSDLPALTTDLIPVKALVLVLPGPGDQDEGDQGGAEAEQEAQHQRDDHHQHDDAHARTLGIYLSPISIKIVLNFQTYSKALLEFFIRRILAVSHRVTEVGYKLL